MDKLPKDGKIVIKINGEEKEFREEIKVFDWQQARKETASAKEEKKVYGLPKTDFFKKKKSGRKSATKIPRKGKVPIPPSLIFASFTAICIGIIMGIFFLQTLEKEETKGKNSDVPVVGGEDTSTDDNTNTELQVNLEDSLIYFLQEGVYQNEEAVIQHVNDMKDGGIPAAYIKGDSHIHVMAVMVDSIDTGKRMLEKPGFSEYWPKEFQLKGKTIQNLTKGEKGFLESALSIYNKLVEEGGKAFFAQSQYQEKSALDEIAKILQNYSQLDKAILKSMHSSLTGAKDELDQYINTWKLEHWHKTQQHLMDFIENYASL